MFLVQVYIVNSTAYRDGGSTGDITYCEGFLTPFNGQSCCDQSDLCNTATKPKADFLTIAMVSLLVDTDIRNHILI